MIYTDELEEGEIKSDSSDEGCLEAISTSTSFSLSSCDDKQPQRTVQLQTNSTMLPLCYPEKLVIQCRRRRAPSRGKYWSSRQKRYERYSEKKLRIRVRGSKRERLESESPVFDFDASRKLLLDQFDKRPEEIPSGEIPDVEMQDVQPSAPMSSPPPPPPPPLSCDSDDDEPLEQLRQQALKSRLEKKPQKPIKNDNNNSADDTLTEYHLRAEALKTALMRRKLNIKKNVSETLASPRQKSLRKLKLLMEYQKKKQELEKKPETNEKIVKTVLSLINKKTAAPPNPPINKNLKLVKINTQPGQQGALKRNQTNSAPVRTVVNTGANKSLVKINNNQQFNMEGGTNVAKTPVAAKKVLNDGKRIIIRLGESSSEDEDDKRADAPPIQPAPPSGAANPPINPLDIDAFLAQKRKESETLLATAITTPEAVHKHLSPLQRLEYIRLKRKLVEELLKIRPKMVKHEMTEEGKLKKRLQELDGFLAQGRDTDKKILAKMERCRNMIKQLAKTRIRQKKHMSTLAEERTKIAGKLQCFRKVALSKADLPVSTDKSDISVAPVIPEYVSVLNPSQGTVRLDPNKEMCPHDLLGICRDDECPYQHHRQPATS